MTDYTTEQIVEAGAEQVEAHALVENWGDDGVVFVGCNCGQWFGKALEGGWSRATQHVAQSALTAMLPLIRKQLADEVRGMADVHPPGYFATRPSGLIDRDRAARLIEEVEL